MGCCLEEHGPWSFEVRSKSIILRHDEWEHEIEWNRTRDGDDIADLRRAIDDLERYLAAAEVRKERRET